MESDQCPSFANAVSRGKPFYTPCDNTVADGTSSSFSLYCHFRLRNVIIQEYPVLSTVKEFFNNSSIAKWQTVVTTDFRH